MLFVFQLYIHMSDKANHKSRIHITGKWWTYVCKIVRHVIKSCHCGDGDDDDDNDNNNNNNNHHHYH